MTRRGTVLALLLRNFITGSAVLAPAGLLMSLGAMALCISSPLMAWLTSGIERRSRIVPSAGVSRTGVWSLLAVLAGMLVLDMVSHGQLLHTSAAAAVFIDLAVAMAFVSERLRHGAAAGPALCRGH
ncbi:hypothetical protein [Pseudorhodoferax sp.]|uniref:hypothetical protein n=1 Tax=Pseudorhodoferax sp. TaxID=1993553 RepID=UPI002DD68083|nr:hypothetical protein [Pseudorhodoferax sp.]